MPVDLSLLDVPCASWTRTVRFGWSSTRITRPPWTLTLFSVQSGLLRQPRIRTTSHGQTTRKLPSLVLTWMSTVPTSVMVPMRVLPSFTGESPILSPPGFRVGLLCSGFS